MTLDLSGGALVVVLALVFVGAAMIKLFDPNECARSRSRRWLHSLAGLLGQLSP